MIKNLRRFWLFGVVLASLYPAIAGEGGMSKEYADAKFQLYKDNVFFCEIAAERAEALNIGETGAQQVRMTGVAVSVFDTQAAATDDENPPLKIRIISPRGTYLQTLDDRGEPQDIVILESGGGKPVIVERYRGGDTLETVITCADTARWNNTASILNGAGAVTMRREDRTLNVSGTDMIYQLSPDRKNKVDILDDSGEDLGGVLEILRDVKMEIVRQDRYGKLLPASATTINSAGAMRYDFDNHRISFVDTVNVTRERLRINSEFLNVLLDSEGDADRFKELVAWCEKGTVKINGRGNPDTRADDIGEWSAVGQYARYNEESGELLITDDRPGMLPLARLENHEIRNQKITYLLNSQLLEALGDRGETRLAGGVGDYDGDKKSAADETVITFKKRLFFDQKNRIAIFEKDVNLRNADLTLNSQKLQVDFLELRGVSKQNDAMARVRKITAIDAVDVVYQNRRARSDRLEMTPSHHRATGSRGLILIDKFDFSGVAQPEIETPGDGYFQAKKITLYRYERAANGQRVAYVEAVGPGSGILGGKKRELGGNFTLGGDGTIVNFKSHMVYDQLTDTVDFYGQVTANSGEQVLASYRLLLYLLGDAEHKEIRRLDAIGNQDERVTLDWRLHHCEAARIVRDYACGRPNVKELIMLEGLPNLPAKVWEENGAVFYGPKIITNPSGSVISSIGAGELTILDRKTNEKAMVQYTGRADYIVSGENSRAIFRDNVTLRRTNMIVTSDAMQADLVKDPTVAATAETPELAGNEISAATLPRRLSRVIVEGNVMVRQGKRQAIGAKGQVNIHDTGDVMILEGNKQQLAEVDNRNGFRLLAPRLMVREQLGLINATGRGQVFISEASASSSAMFASEGFSPSSSGDYKLAYGGQMTYNMPEGKIIFQREVVMTQASLQAKCDFMTIMLERGVSAVEDNNVRIDSLECAGNVYFNSFPAAVVGVADPFNLPGVTVRTRSANATYSAPLHRIVLSGTPLPQVLRSQVPAVNEMSRIFQQNERVWIDTQSGMIDFGGAKQSISPWPADRPLIFPGERQPWLPSS